MPIPVDYEQARSVLDSMQERAEADLLANQPAAVPANLAAACDSVFSSRTQSYREVLLGCIVARIQNQEIDIRRPYASQGERAFNGRTLDERVVNPFLSDNRIPSTRAPYLAVFRRQVRLDDSSREAMRDQVGYDAMLDAIDHIEQARDKSELDTILRYFLYRFLELRNLANIPVARLSRISHSQYDALISTLLATPSGGRFPMLLAVAMFKTLDERFRLGWSIEWQGINEADKATGAGADISIVENGQIALAVEVTERPIDRARVVSTFNNKIAVNGIPDYSFLVTTEPNESAKMQAGRYFAQGYDVNFYPIEHWLSGSLAVLGREGRDVFNRILVELLEGAEVTSAMRQSWNRQIEALTTT